VTCLKRRKKRRPYDIIAGCISNCAGGGARHFNRPGKPDDQMACELKSAWVRVVSTQAITDAQENADRHTEADATRLLGDACVRLRETAQVRHRRLRQGGWLAH
jgi:hypothetical protein